MIDKNALPEEWIELVKLAMSSRITKENFKRFLEEIVKRENTLTQEREHFNEK